MALANEIITKLNEGKTFAEVVEEYKDQITHEELGYQGKTASLEQNYIDELVSLKDGEYEISFDYDNDKYIKKATIESN